MTSAEILQVETMPDNWRALGACANTKDPAFFEPDYERAKDRQEREAYINGRYCSWCPVRNDCGDFAAHEYIQSGIWGGNNMKPLPESDEVESALVISLPLPREVSPIERSGSKLTERDIKRMRAVYRTGFRLTDTEMTDYQAIKQIAGDDDLAPGRVTVLLDVFTQAIARDGYLLNKDDRAAVFFMKLYNYQPEDHQVFPWLTEQLHRKIGDSLNDYMKRQRPAIITHVKEHVSAITWNESDLVQEGIFGYIQAMRSFDLGQTNATVRTYSKYRMAGAIIDQLRRNDRPINIPRSVTAKLKVLDERVVSGDSLNASDKEMLDDRENTNVLSLERLLSSENILQTQLEEPLSPDLRFDAEEIVLDQQVSRDKVHHLLVAVENELSPRHRQAIELHFGIGGRGDARTLHEVGQVLNVTESRICQMIKAAKKAMAFHTELLLED